jgi:hypothetical protein
MASPAMAMDVDATRWPAWVGLGLAAVTFAVAAFAATSGHPARPPITRSSSSTY